MKRWYIGRVYGGGLRAFTSETNPTEDSHGDTYAYVVGPFDTKRGAMWAEAHGENNPHFAHVDDAERIARTIA